MAEHVQKHLESLVSVIQEMQRINIYTPTETRAMIKAYKSHEVKINGPVKTRQDYKEYIKFLKDLITNIKLRRAKLKVAYRKSHIEHHLLRCMKHIYEIAIQNFPNDFDLSLAYFNFCKESNFNQTASLAIKNMIRNFAMKPETWTVGASWFMKQDVKHAISLLHKGLTIHPCSSDLYIQIIEMELMCKEKADWPVDPEKIEQQEQTCYSKIDTYVDTLFANVNNYQCLVEVVNILDQHCFARPIQEKIIKTLMIQYRNEEKVWGILADREWKGRHYPYQEPPTSLQFRLERCIKKFEEGLSEIEQRRKNSLREMYLDYLIALHREEDSCNSYIKAHLLKKFNEAKDLTVLAERYYIIWAKLETDERTVVSIVEDGITMNPNSVDLWILKLRCLVMRNANSLEINEVFKTGLEKLKDKAGPLWQMILNYHIVASPNSVIERVYRDAISQPKEVANCIKPDYIEWVALNKDVNVAREVYKELANREPYCKELHTKMYKLETNEVIINVEHMEYPMLLACKQFGNEDPDVWINLRNMYYQYNQAFQDYDESFDLNEKTLKIRQEAEASLKSNVIMLADFRDKFDAPVNIECEV